MDEDGKAASWRWCRKIDGHVEVVVEPLQDIDDKVDTSCPALPFGVTVQKCKFFPMLTHEI